ncbi:MAG: hypothetical protein ABF532_09280 [Bifidobacterium sp.]|uniref:hypothetical protein n=1 Tax=Bifidobacterium sp. TaxID=41200 RepID=UPI0039E97494
MNDDEMNEQNVIDLIGWEKAPEVRRGNAALKAASIAAIAIAFAGSVLYLVGWLDIGRRILFIALVPACAAYVCFSWHLTAQEMIVRCRFGLLDIACIARRGKRSVTSALSESGEHPIRYVTKDVYPHKGTLIVQHSGTVVDGNVRYLVAIQRDDGTYLDAVETLEAARSIEEGAIAHDVL